MAKKLRDIIKKTAHSKGDEKFTKDHLSGRNSVSYKNDKPTENDKQFTMDVVQSVQDTDSAHKGSAESTYDSVNENRHRPISESKSQELDEGLGEGPLLPTKDELKMGLRVAGKQWKAAGSQVKNMTRPAVKSMKNWLNSKSGDYGLVTSPKKLKFAEEKKCDKEDKKESKAKEKKESKKELNELSNKTLRSYVAKAHDRLKTDPSKKNVGNYHKARDKIIKNVDKVSDAAMRAGAAERDRQWGRTGTPLSFVKQYQDMDKAKALKEETELNEGLGHGARELTLFADNDSNLHRQSHEPIMKNLALKHKKGKYDHEKSKKLWGYHADRAAQAYHKQFGSKDQPWHKMFSTADRKEAAAHWADSNRPDKANEEVIQELSPTTLKSYKDKAGSDINKNFASGNVRKAVNRASGYAKANWRLKGVKPKSLKGMNEAKVKCADGTTLNSKWYSQEWKGKKFGKYTTDQVKSMDAIYRTWKAKKDTDGKAAADNEYSNKMVGPSTATHPGSWKWRQNEEANLEEGHGMFRANTYGTNNEPDNDGKKYKIIRFHRKGGSKTITRGVSLSYAKSHCSHPETSSSTCAGKNAKAYTRRHGDWFDGYDKQ